MPRQEAALTHAVEPLQIPVPRKFEGTLTNPDATELYVNSEFQPYTLDEIGIIRTFLEKKVSYTQSLKLGAYLVDGDDALFSKTHDELDALESQEKRGNTRTAIGGGERQTRERVLILREFGYSGNGDIHQTALPMGANS